MPTYSKPEIVLPKSEVWEELTPQIFERFAADVVQFLAPEANIQITPASNDGGRDLIIRGKRKLTGRKIIYGEAKRTRMTGLANIARSVLSALNNDDCDLLIIVTSGKINLSSFAEARAVLAEKKVDFQVIHRAVLTSILTKNTEMVETYHFIDHMKSHGIDAVRVLNQKINDIVTHYAFTLVSEPASNTPSVRHIHINTEETEKLKRIRQDETLRLGILVENNTGFGKDVVVKIKQTAMWHARKKATRTQHLEPYGSAYCEYLLELNANSAANLPNIEVHNEKGTSVPIIAIDAGRYKVEPYYRAPYYGHNAHEMKGKLKRILTGSINNAKSGTVFISGPAGIGKTRLFNEVERDIRAELIGGSEIEYYRCNIEPGKSSKPLQGIARSIGVNLCPIHSPPNTAWDVGDYAHLVGSCLVRPCCILIEDLHHADSVTIQIIQGMIKELNIKKGGNPIFLVLSGRNDDTFFNKDFDKFQTFLSCLQKEFSISDAEPHIIVEKLVLEEMTDRDMRALISAIFTHGITESAIEKILPLCDSRPFNLFQVLEYLTEEAIAELHYQNGYSIKNPDVFFAKEGFPTTLLEVFEERLRSLHSKNESGLVFLMAFALWGYEIPLYAEGAISRMIGNGGFRLLLERNYLAPKDDLTYQFNHENIIHYLFELETIPLVEESASKAAKLLLQLPAFEHMNSLQQCRIYHYANTQTTRSELQRIVFDEMGERDATHISQLNNLLTSQKILEYGEKHLTQKATQGHGYVNDLFDLLYMKSFTLKFTQNYYSTIKHVQLSLAKMEGILRDGAIPRTSDHKLKIARLNQIIGHAAQNASDIKISKMHIDKVVAYLFHSHSAPSTTERLDLVFEALDRGRKNLLYVGDLDGAEQNTESLIAVVKEKQDPYLGAIAGLGRAEVYFVQSPEKAFKLWKENQPHVDDHAEDRIALTARLIGIQEHILRNAVDINVLNQQLNTCMKEAEDKRFVGPLPKIHLLQGVCWLLHKEYEDAIISFRNAYNEAEKYGYGVFLWLSMNNCALAYHALGDKEEAYHAYETAWQHAKKQGFYEYPVQHASRPLFFQNALVANYLAYATANDYENIRLEISKTLGITDPKEMDTYLSRPADPLFMNEGLGYFMTFI